MSISYEEARRLVEKLGESVPCVIEDVSLHNALGRLSAETIFSKVSTPQYDTSAMDGYAVRSKETQNASEATPLWLKFHGTIAAGEVPIALCDDGSTPLSCIEIMTGARFPEGDFDAVVPVERAIRDGDNVRITTAVRQDQHRRFARSDFARGDCVVPRRTVVKSQHIMALASVGITAVPVLRIRAGIWSTGLEIMNGMTNDANGPYLTAALREQGIEAEFAGVIPDDPQALVDALERSDSFDLLLTTGAVSAGKFDFIRAGLEMMNAKIHFHHVTIRPGHPVLCASIGKTVFFGLPGNPVAAAACMQFLVIPYLKGCAPTSLMQRQDLPTSQVFDIFRHAKAVNGSIEVNPDQSPAKVKSFSQSTCWIHIKRDTTSDGHSCCYLL